MNFRKLSRSQSCAVATPTSSGWRTRPAFPSADAMPGIAPIQRAELTREWRSCSGQRALHDKGTNRLQMSVLGSTVRPVLFILLMLSGLARAAEPELLEPDKAFRFAARLQDVRSIEVSYQIAPGYYMYRDKFRFTLAPAGVKGGERQLPAGKK